MGKLAREKQHPEAPPTPTEALVLTFPLFGITKGAAGKYVVVKWQAGKVEALSPKRRGEDSGEALHFAIARAVQAFEDSITGRR